jgi:uncharacterized protein
VRDDRPTSTLKVPVADLRRRLGERRIVPLEVRLDALEVVASRSKPEVPIVGEVVIDSIERGVTVLGQISFAWIGDCRRCLEPVDGTCDVIIDEIYQIAAPENSDLLELLNDQVDLLPLVRDAVLVGLPLAPLCSDECTGPDPDRYPAKTVDDLAAERAAEEPRTDPRWAALENLDLDE